MDNKRRLVPFIKSILRWSVILVLLLAVLTAIEYTVSRRAGVIATVFLGLYIIIVVIMYLVKHKTLVLELVRFGVNYSNVQRRLDQELEIPYAILDKTGSVLWSNKKLLDMVGNKIRPRQAVTTLFPELTNDEFPEGEEQANVFIECNSMHYRVLMKNLTIEGIKDDSRWGSDKLRPSEESGETLVIAFTPGRAEGAGGTEASPAKTQAEERAAALTGEARAAHEKKIAEDLEKEKALLAEYNRLRAAVGRPELAGTE